MPRTILTHFDFVGNEIRRARVQNLASAPSSPVVGQIYFDTTVNHLGAWTGTVWEYTTAVADATTTVKGIVQLAGDLAGTAAAPTLSATKDANVKARGNHTGTQLAATISDFDTQVRTSRLDQMTTPTLPVAFGSQRITGVLDPTSAQDAATRNYVDNVVATGIAWKQPVRAASTANVSLTAPGATLNGVTLVTGDRVLLIGQTVAADNGIYVWTGAAATMTRATDADTAVELNGATVLITQGTAPLVDTVWNLTTDTITLGSTALSWVNIQSGTSVVGDTTTTTRAGNAIATIRPTTPTAPANGAVSVGAFGVSRTSPFTMRGDGTVTAFNVAHGLASTMVAVQLFDSAGLQVEVDMTIASASTVTLTFVTAPVAALQYTGVVIG